MGVGNVLGVREEITRDHRGVDLGASWQLQRERSGRKQDRVKGEAGREEGLMA